MHKASVLVSLITSDNDFQLGQAAAAEDAAARLGMNVSILFADNDAVNQASNC
jgi:ABC-type sugar transport system substrate-binding protein